MVSGKLSAARSRSALRSCVMNGWAWMYFEGSPAGAAPAPESARIAKRTRRYGPRKKERLATEYTRRMEQQESVQKRSRCGRLCELQSFDRFGHAVPEAGVRVGGVGIGSAQREDNVGRAGPILCDGDVGTM